MNEISEKAVEVAVAAIAGVELEELRPDTRTFYYGIVRTALAAALPHVVGWRPIETAPRDGRTIILARETAFLGFWDKHQSAWCDNRNFFRDPTHWMPLPPAPTNQERGDGSITEDTK